MNIKQQILSLWNTAKHWLVFWITASLIFSAVYAFTTPLPQVTTWNTLTAQWWNDMVDAVNDEYLEDGTEVLTNKTWTVGWVTKPIYRRIITGDPDVWATKIIWNVPNVTPVWNWVTAWAEYRYGSFSHQTYSISYNYQPSTWDVRVRQASWDNTTFSKVTFIFEYTKN